MSERIRQEILEELDNAWLCINPDAKMIKPLDILDTETPSDFHQRFAWLCTQPEYFSFVCKHILNIELLPFQALILKELWVRKFPMFIGSRGLGKSFLLGVHAMLRTILLPERKVIIAGAAFRQSKIIYDYIEKIWSNAPVLRDMGDRSDGCRASVDQCNFRFGGGFTRAIPIGDGSKIRGQRANDIIADEFQSQVIEIFENIIAGFGAVSATPVENVKQQARAKKISELKKKYGTKEVERIIGKEDQHSYVTSMPNQVVISGTAYYDFNHFAKYHKKWRSIIKTRGDERLLKELFSGEEVPAGFDWRDYSIFRIPISLAPKGFMEEAQIARAKATIHSGIFLMEYSACFSKDSKGFFKRTLLEYCTTSDNQPVVSRLGNEVIFDGMLRGNPKKEYVLGIDPASERDNFAMTIVEINEDHNRIVYCWTINRKKHAEQIKEGLVNENNYYAYCALKIRELMRKFKIVRIAMDSQGGGVTIGEFLHDDKYYEPHERAIWPIIEEDKEKDTDHFVGDHILELCNFAKYDWLRDANHGLRKAFEDKELLFPRFDPVTIALAIEEDGMNNRKIDTFEDCIMEIQELKNELCLIELTTTANGRDRWDVPEVKIGIGKKQKMNKDRYSSLLLAQAGAKAYGKVPDPMELSYGGVADLNRSTEKPDFYGPAWFIEAVKGVYD